MAQGFAGIFGTANRVHVLVSAEAATNRPEMEWLAAKLNQVEPRFLVEEILRARIRERIAASRPSP